MDTEFASSRLTAGQLNAIVKKIGGHDAVLGVLRGELVVSVTVRPWQDKDGVIRFSVTSDGTTGPEWIDRLEKKGFRTSCNAKGLLYSPDFQPTSGVTYEVVVLKGMCFGEKGRTTKDVREEGDHRQYIMPHVELSCLIREKFTDKEIHDMGLWMITIMHKPIKDSSGHLSLLEAKADSGASSCYLDSFSSGPDCGWDHGCGFAFVVSQHTSL
jgi:hypothetical protein